MITRYKAYLDFLDSKLKNMFEKQKAMIKCHRGCSLCCEKGKYPMSELEFVYLLMGYEALGEEVQNTVKSQIMELLSSPTCPDSYVCPFLVNHECSVYDSRAIICRTFGLMSYDQNNAKRIPFCVDENLNYADVFDNETSRIVRKAPDGTEPVAFNVSREFLTNKDFEKMFQLYFGEDKALYDWLKEEFLQR